MIKISEQKGIVIIIAFAVLGVLVLLSIYFISFAITESKISESHKIATRTYYLAEAGINEAIWKLKNDDVWKNNFIDENLNPDPQGKYWSDSFIAGSVLGGSYTVTIQNSACAMGEITSTATFETAQRVVKTKVFKGQISPLEDYIIFTGGPSENIYISSTNPLNIHNGSLFSNNNINIKDLSVVNVDNLALAHNNINVSFLSQLNAANGRCAKGECSVNCPDYMEGCSECPPAQKPMPSIDFDSSDPNSYLEMAKNDNCSSVRTDGKTNCVFTPGEFENLMWPNPDLTLPADTVIYVTGDVNIRADQILRLEGVLVADRDINLGKDYYWTSKKPPYLRLGFSQLIIDRPGSPEENKPAGILTKRKINGGGWFGFGVESLDVHGLVYAGDEMSFSSVGASMTINGGIAVRKFTLSSMWYGVDIWLDSDVIADTFKSSAYSPVITIDHWEETY